MDQELANLIGAALAFVGSHFALSHPWRAPLVKRLGAGGFAGFYSLVALITLGWMVMAFRAVPHQQMLPWDGSGALPWGLASTLMLAASVLLVGSFRGNPALPAPGAAALARRRPNGVFRITRHPMMWSFALWSAAHALVSPSTRVLILTATIGFLALAGAMMQDHKKARLMGDNWIMWHRQTSYWPQVMELPKAGLVPWLSGAALWLGATWAHGWLIAVPAGLWRWL